MCWSIWRTGASCTAPVTFLAENKKDGREGEEERGKDARWSDSCGEKHAVCNSHHNGKTIVIVERVGGHQDMFNVRLLPF